MYCFTFFVLLGKIGERNRNQCAQHAKIFIALYPPLVNMKLIYGGNICDYLSFSFDYLMFSDFAIHLFRRDGYMQHILGLVRRCVEDYHMIEPGEIVAVGVSGGRTAC